jgi:hypothetical protein
VAREKTGKVINLANRKQNESKFHSWEETGSGGRIYRLKIAGRLGWTAFYLKEVDSLENTIRFWQEIYDERNVLREIHEKFPIDHGHHKF